MENITGPVSFAIHPHNIVQIWYPITPSSFPVMDSSMLPWKFMHVFFVSSVENTAQWITGFHNAIISVYHHQVPPHVPTKLPVSGYSGADVSLRTFLEVAFTTLSLKSKKKKTHFTYIRKERHSPVRFIHKQTFRVIQSTEESTSFRVL